MTLQKQSNKIVLPCELERDILELAANSFQGLAFRLCTLSKYVQPWYDSRFANTLLCEKLTLTSGWKR